MNYELIISDIKNYKYLNKRIQEISNEIVGIDHQLYGIRSGSFEDFVINGKEYRQFYHGGYISELDKIERTEALNNKKEKFIDEMRMIKARLEQVDYCLNNVDAETRSIIQTIYLGKGWKYAKNYYHLSSSSLQRRMRKAIERL